MKSWVLAGIVSLAGMASGQAQEVQQTGGFLKHKSVSSEGCSTCGTSGGSHSGHGGSFGAGASGYNSQANHPWAYRPYGSFFGHGASQQLPVFQAAPWYLYFPYNAHFQTPAPIGGGYYPPPIMGGGYGGGMPYFPGTSPVIAPQFAPQQMQPLAPVVPVPATPTKMPIVIPPVR